jgi:signal transduction histidine kinase
VVCDAGQIQQIVLGLLVNATEAMKASNGGKLRVETRRDGDAGVVIGVRDDGPGIPPEVMPHIFEPFYTTKTDEQRTGLGLAVAKSIVETHGGEITVESQPGKGAAFTIRLPLEAPAQQMAASAQVNGASQ